MFVLDHRSGHACSMASGSRTDWILLGLDVMYVSLGRG